ncbi:MAG TPA: GNAT family N-acetyltransferase [Actinoplanes sp.]|jgi:GNAT superfamily N-acetyltransferase
MLVLRPLTDADVDAVAAVHVRTWQVGYAGIMPDEVLNALDPAVFAESRRSRNAWPGAQTVVAEDDGTIVGFTSFGPHRREHGGSEFVPGIGEIYAIYVTPERWGTGVGRALMTAARDALAAAGDAEMRLWVLTENVRARRFYERAGMVADGAISTFTPQGSTAELAEIRYAMRLD